MRFPVMAATSTLACLLTAALAPASYTYVFSGITNGQVIPAGTTLPVTISLQFTADTTGGTGFSPPFGLQAARTAVRYSPPPTGVTLAASGGAINPQFDNGSVITDPAQVPTETGFNNLIGFNLTSTAQTGVQSPTNTVLLGTFNVTFGNTSGANQTVTLRGNRLNPVGVANVATTDGSGTNFPQDAFVLPGNISVTISSVPEPTSMALVGLAATGFAGAVWRKRRPAKTVADAEVAV